jgi:hypothetical protein
MSHNIMDVISGEHIDIKIGVIHAVGISCIT